MKESKDLKSDEMELTATRREGWQRRDSAFTIHNLYNMNASQNKGSINEMNNSGKMRAYPFYKT